MSQPDINGPRRRPGTELVRWQICVVAVEPESVWCRCIDMNSQSDTPEEEIEIPMGRFIRMMGRESLHEGQLGMMVVKARAADGSGAIRGWPYRRRWTAEDIAAIEAAAEDLWNALHDSTRRQSPGGHHGADPEIPGRQNPI